MASRWRCVFSRATVLHHFIWLVGLGMGALFYLEVSEALRLAAIGVPTRAKVYSVVDETYADGGSVQIGVRYFAPPPAGRTSPLSPGTMYLTTLNLADHDDPCPEGHGSLCLAEGDEVRILYDPARPEAAIFHATPRSILTRPANVLGVLMALAMFVGGLALLFVHCASAARRDAPPPTR